MAHLNQCLLLNTEKTEWRWIQEVNPSVLFELHQGLVINERQYVTKMALNVPTRGLWKDFIPIFFIVEYLQKPIYIWNKISKCIMFQCGMEFQFISLHIVYNFQHSEPIEYFNDLFRSLPTFQINNCKVHIDLDDFSISFKNLILNFHNQLCIFIGMQILILHQWTFWKVIGIRAIVLCYFIFQHSMQ
jgi:hypothetical protein